ncbi:MAG TPA: diaminopimelate decarboxylase [Actinomycetales bacterium]|nr:diaminopimelate decarboxylase [Actinomycetales bacterium]
MNRTTATPWPVSWVPARGEEPARIGGRPVTELAGDYGTPVFVVDLEELTARMDAWVSGAAEAFSEDAGLAGADVYYASKAFTCTAVVRLARERGMRVDVASGGELAVALRAGMPGEHIGLHGNNKSPAELRAALEAGVGRIVADSLSEISLLSELAADAGVSDVPVFLRVTTGVHAGANEYVSTAHEDQKFGLSAASGAALEAARAVVGSGPLALTGLHMHIGSQIFGPEGHDVSARALLRLRAEIARETGVLVDEVDLGGGFGVTYVDEAPTAVREMTAVLARGVREECEALGTPPPRISFEPGRSVIGPAMVTLYEVGTTKTVTVEDGERWYVSFDGGMTDNVLRPMLYGSEYVAEVASREPGGEGRRSRLVGKHCESGDIMIRELRLPADLTRGDLLAIPATGAYGRSMASNYNMLLRPPVIAVREDSQPEVWLRRETLDDLLATDPGAPHSDPGAPHSGPGAPHSGLGAPHPGS